MEFSYRWDIYLTGRKLYVDMECKNEMHTTHSSGVDMTSVLTAPLSSECFPDDPLLNSQIWEADTERRRNGERHSKRKIK